MTHVTHRETREDLTWSYCSTLNCVYVSSQQVRTRRHPGINTREDVRRLRANIDELQSPPSLNKFPEHLRSLVSTRDDYTPIMPGILTKNSALKAYIFDNLIHLSLKI